jgi:hypothetical protein
LLREFIIYTCLPVTMIMCRPSPAQTTIPLTASSWYLLTCNASVPQAECGYKPDKAAPLSGAVPGEIQFTFPGPPTQNYTVNYLTTAFTQSIASRSSITISLGTQAVSGSPVFNYAFQNTCDYPAHVRPYIERKGDNGYNPNYRWWADDPYSYELDTLLGTVTIVVPLDPAYWSNVNGEIGSTNPSAFQAALANPMRIGMTMGGGCYFGHGVNVTGGVARFDLMQYQVN